MADNEKSSFTFWANMKDAIEVYKDKSLKYRLYDAVTEYGLYGVMPEDDGTTEAQTVIAFVQAIAPSLDKSRGYYEKKSKAGAHQKVDDDQLKQAIIEATKEKGKMPTRPDIVRKVLELYGVEISDKTISRRISEDERKKLIQGALSEEEPPKVICPFDF